MSTLQKVLAATQLKPRNKNEYRGPSPLRPDSDGDSFALYIQHDEYGHWEDYANKGTTPESGTLYDLADALGIERPTSNGASPAASIANLADYARQHGVDESVFKAAGWFDTTAEQRAELFSGKISAEYVERPAIGFKTASGNRYRFLDNIKRKPKYISETGFNRCWYGLDKAIQLASESGQPLVICNGEASTVVAQHYGIAACCQSGGESRLMDGNLNELNNKWQGPVWVALDSDDTGRRAALAIKEQLKDAVVVDLDLFEGGDLADFCKLHTTDATNQLRALVPRTATQPTNSRDVATHIIETLNDNEIVDGKPFVMPFTKLHELGGMAEITTPGHLIGIMAPSGHGKTSFLETMIDMSLQRGESGVWWGPEWTPVEYGRRRVHRLGGPTGDDFKRWSLWKYYTDSDREARIPTNARMFTDVQRQKLREVTNKILKWPGVCEYEPSTKPLDQLLDLMAARVKRMRDDGHIVVWAVFDYIQMITLSTKNYDAGNQFEYGLQLIKNWCIDHELVGIVGSQVNKTETAKVGENTIIQPASANWIKEDKIQLLISLNSVYVDDWDNPLPSGDPGKKISNMAYVAVIKNNEGRKGNVKMRSDFENLRWLDDGWYIEKVVLPRGEDL